RPRPWQGRALPTELLPLINWDCKFNRQYQISNTHLSFSKKLHPSLFLNPDSLSAWPVTSSQKKDLTVHAMALIHCG
ncbi:MAG TPA: hypothetical protein PKK67_08595, partial [Cyclobacteriaceae bacterium]|nr:hypothetical protein [Cyclobacteriaceae bacterium]